MCEKNWTLYKSWLSSTQDITIIFLFLINVSLITGKYDLIQAPIKKIFFKWLRTSFGVHLKEKGLLLFYKKKTDLQQKWLYITLRVSTGSQESI